MDKRVSLLLVLLSIPPAQSATPSSAESRYNELCAGCHGADIASAFRNVPSMSDGTAEEVAQVIREGRPSRGMPAFGRTLSEADVNSLASLLRERATSQETSPSGSMVGRTIEAETLRTDRSAGYSMAESGSDRFLMYIDRGSHLCYDDVDLTGIRSIEYRYAKGEGEPPRRFAILAFRGRDFDSSSRFHLGEKITTLTGGWETFRTERIGLSQQLEGRYRLCFIGMDGGGVFNLDKFTLSDQPGQNDGMTVDFEVPHETLVGAGHAFRLEKIGEVAGELWSMDFLRDDSIIATQKSGSLWLFKNGERIGPIEGIPKVWFRGQGGLHTVKTHPDYANNGWIYLSYADGTPQGSMTAIVRGRIKGNKWIDEQLVYKAPANLYLNSEAHYGSSLAFAGDYLYFSVGDRGQQDKAQDLSTPYGKIHRIFADGRIPKDNPFVDKQTALPTIWSYGHRNPQGVTVQPKTGEVWATEHGPKGGDELNRILKGTNYGWPVVTFGINYDGTIVSNDTHKEGIEPPKLHWSPSIGVSALRFYTGTQFPKWRNQLLVASLARQELRLIRIESNKVVKEETVIQGMGRIRDVSVGPDGNPYVVLNLPNGMIFRLVRTEPSRS
jgi:aldose sugar dehydrogenase